MKYKNSTKSHSSLTAIDLFAGAGGFSLGLHRAGFQVVLANESSVDAEWTYRQNLIEFNENPWLIQPLNNNESHSLRVRRALGRKSLQGNRDSPPDEFHQSMRGGKISEVLTDDWVKNWLLHNKYKNIDILVAGPPCQGFSTAGKQDDSDERNQLIWEAVRIINIVHPRIIVIENVPGMLTGHSELLKRVADSLSIDKLGYYLTIELLHVKHYGVPQTRKRLVIVGVRKDLITQSGHSRLRERIFPVGCPTQRKSESRQNQIVKSLDSGDTLTVGTILGDLMPHPPIFETVNIPQKYNYRTKNISDFQMEMRTPKSLYLQGGTARSIFNQEYWNHEASRHNHTVVARIKKLRETAESSLKANDQRCRSSWLKQQFTEAHPHLDTKKAAQRVLLKTHWPNLTVTSLPDDIVHFSENRIPTVREMARLQTFPDWFEFCGVRTTGFERRRAGIYVPQYTQVANAVPPRMAFAIAAKINRFLELIRTDPSCSWPEGPGLDRKFDPGVNQIGSAYRTVLDDLNKYFQDTAKIIKICQLINKKSSKKRRNIKKSRKIHLLTYNIS